MRSFRWFLRDGSNRRRGRYGGPLENRARLMLEVLAAVCAEIGSDRVGLRLSPLNGFNDMRDSDPVGLASWLAMRLNDFGLAYLHLMRVDMQGRQHGDVLTPVREHFRGVLVANMGFTPAEAAGAVAAGSWMQSLSAGPSSPTPICPGASARRRRWRRPIRRPSTAGAPRAIPTTPSWPWPEPPLGASCAPPVATFSTPGSHFGHPKWLPGCYFV